ncbi:MAG: tetratricopeptide repeat protein [Actinomycetota bacterium]
MSDQRREQIELLHEELADIDAQVRDGDLDVATASKIRSRYEDELAEIEASEHLEPEATLDEEDPTETDTRGGRFDQRALMGIGLVAIALVVIGVFAVRSLNTPSVVGADGIVGDVVRGEGQIDLSTITNDEMEVVVAENPDIVPMRLALAGRYFEAGEFDKALDHYFEVLDREQHPEALANVGWMTYLSGRPDIAAGYVEVALERQPDFLAAKWFLGNIYTTLGRYDEAEALLVAVMASDEVPDEVKESAVELLEQIKAES